jgi:hypothetical protein
VIEFDFDGEPTVLRAWWDSDDEILTIAVDHADPDGARELGRRVLESTHGACRGLRVGPKHGVAPTVTGDVIYERSGA